MSKTISEVIAELQGKISDLEAQTSALKRKVNDLCSFDGTPEIYPDVPPDEASSVKVRTVKLRPDEFTADKLMKAIRRYLEMRKNANPDNAPAKPEEICAALRDGGYDFRGKEPISAVSISLGKSTHTFKRLSPGLFGLASWYGLARPTKPKHGNGGNGSDEEDEDQVEAPGVEPQSAPTVPETHPQ
jgi:hypothetical protein